MGGAAIPAAADTPAPRPLPSIEITLPGITLSVSPPVAAPPSVDALEAALLTRLNAERAAGGLAALGLQPWVSSVARAHSQEMAGARDIWHNRTGYLDVARQAIGAYLTGENVAEAGTLDETDSLLMNSPPHRANILYPAFNYVGIGVALDAAGYVYVTQDFVTIRAARAVAPAVAAAPRVALATVPVPSPAIAKPVPAVMAAAASPPPLPPAATPVASLSPLAASPVAATSHLPKGPEKSSEKSEVAPLKAPDDAAIRWAILLAALASAFHAWFVRQKRPGDEAPHRGHPTTRSPRTRSRKGARHPPGGG